MLPPAVIDPLEAPLGKAAADESTYLPVALVRYGAVPEVARCDISAMGQLVRGEHVVIRSARGEQSGIVLEVLRRRQEPLGAHVQKQPEEAEASFDVIRVASPGDLQRIAELRQSADNEYPHWVARIQEWELDIQLVDLEWTLDGQRILYVLNERGPDCTKLALRAAAAGLGIVSVQPVSAEGLVTLPASTASDPSRCGSSGGSCGCHS